MDKDISKQISDAAKRVETIKALAASSSLVSELNNTIRVSEDRKNNPVKWAYGRLKEYIVDFEKGLDEEHEVGVRLVSFGQELMFHIEEIGYYGPDIITFYGILDSGGKVQLIQHISQLSVLLVAVKKMDKNARRITGFSKESKNQDKGN